MRVKETSVYSFDELSDRAKESAREWYRQSTAEDFASFSADSILDDASRIAALFGLNISTRPVKLMNGSTRYDPNVFWAVSSRDSGASFAGDYSYQKGSVQAVKAECPQDIELHRIVQTLANAQRQNFYKLQARISHGRSDWRLDIEVERSDDRYTNLANGTEAGVKDALTDFANWIRAQLEAEFEYLTSDTQVEESIRINDYEFTAEGKRA